MNETSVERIPTNLVVGFLGSGKTTAIANLLNQRQQGEKWSVLVNEFGQVSVDHALFERRGEDVAVEQLGGGCACCTMAFTFQPLLAQFVRRTKPDRLIIEPSGLSHPAKVVDILRGPNFSKSIQLRNVICLIDPHDYKDVQWRESAVFQDQIQLADIVVLNWTDSRDRGLIDECRRWVEQFRPPKPLVMETEFGALPAELLDAEFHTRRFALFANAHPIPDDDARVLPTLAPVTADWTPLEGTHNVPTAPTGSGPGESAPRQPRRFQNDDSTFDACGWIFHVDDVFERDKLLDLLAYVRPIVRLKGVFRCQDDWWVINRAKEATSYNRTAYRRDSRLEIIMSRSTTGWPEFEAKLIACLADPPKVT